MPRNAVDTCIICGEVKCRCGRPERPKTPKSRKAQPRAVPPPTTAATLLPSPEPAVEPSSTFDPTVAPHPAKAAVRAAMKARAARSQPASPAAPTAHDPTEEAIRVLMPILHPDERAKHSALVTRHSPASVRAAVWRQKVHGNGS